MAADHALRAPRVQAKEGLEAILTPRSVAVVGASSRPGAVGHEILRSILEGGFAGPVYAVNPRAGSVLGRRCWPSVAALPEAPDLAVIALPAPQVVEAAEACGARGVRGLVVLSAGFRESDEEGARREEALRDAVRRHGMRMVGPNCLGVVNASPAVRLHATFAPRPMRPGHTALVTQSGAVGVALLEHAAQVGLGVSRFVSMGNKTDVSGNDLLLLWESDPEVQQVLMYLENLGNPRNFVRIARRFTKSKPIVVLKSGRTAPGARAAGSHTGALTQSDDLVEAMLAQCGVLRADTVDDLFDVGAAVATQPRLAGPRIGIVTNSGGPAILAVDRLPGAGLALAGLGEATVAGLRRLLPPASHPANPVDLLASGDAAAFRFALRLLQDDPGIDGLIAIWTPLHEGDAGPAEAIAAALRPPAAKPGVAVVFGHGPSTPAFRALASAGVPTYTFPEHAVASLGALRRVARWQEAPLVEPSPRPVDAQAARRALDAAPRPEGGWLAMRDAFALVQAYGIPLPRHRFVSGPDAPAQAAAAAEAMGAAVALKLDAPNLVHKTEAGAVRLRLGPGEVRPAAQAMLEAAAARGLAPTGIMVMEMAPPGPEILVGALQDPLFGPFVACGAGGVYTEVLKDVRFRLAPVAAVEVEAMLDSLRIAPLLAGARGEGPRDRAALVDAVVRVAQMASDLPEVREVELNPVRALAQGAGALALDARVRVGAAPGR